MPLPSGSQRAGRHLRPPQAPGRPSRLARATLEGLPGLPGHSGSDRPATARLLKANKPSLVAVLIGS